MPVKPEHQIQQEIAGYLRGRGAVVEKIHGGVYQSTGISDFLVCWKGRYLAIEVKRPGFDATPKQLSFLNKIEAAGGIGMVAHSVDEVRDVLGFVEHDPVAFHQLAASIAPTSRQHCTN